MNQTKETLIQKIKSKVKCENWNIKNKWEVAEILKDCVAGNKLILFYEKNYNNF